MTSYEEWRVTGTWLSGDPYEAVAVRGDRVVVRRSRWETEHPCWELRVKPKPLGHAMARILNRFGHDRHRRTV